MSGCSTRQDKNKISKIEMPEVWHLAEDIVGRIKAPEIPDSNYLITDFGAVPNSHTDNKGAFDAVMALCRENGGGRIIVPTGKFMVNGPIHFESNVEIHLEEGAEIIFGANPEDYLPVVLTRWEGTLLYNYSPFIYAFRKHDMAITGNGTINGNGAALFQTWQKEQRPDQLALRAMNNDGTPVEERIFGDGHKLRPTLIQFYECESIKIEGITITNSPFWCIQPVFSKGIEVSNISFDAQNLNNDGIDPDSSEDIYIHDIDFNNRDDNIAIKSGRDREGRELARPSRNIVIRRCRWKGHNAVCMGSEMSGGISNVFIENCSFNGSVRAGVYLKSNRDRGGAIHDIYVRDMELDTCLSVVEMDTDYKNEGEGHLSNFYNVYIERLQANYARDHGIYIQGMEGRPIHTVYLKDVTVVTSEKEALINHARGIKMDRVQVGGKTLESIPEHKPGENKNLQL